MIGTVIGNYRITAELGDGGAGAVFRAIDQATSRDVAIRQLRPVFGQKAEVVQNLAELTASLGRLNNPNIATPLGVFQSGGDVLVITEFVSGESLASVLRRVGRMPWRVAAEYAIQVLRALEEAHGAGAIHGGIRASNLMLAQHGQLKVVDFGIAFLGVSQGLIDGSRLGSRLAHLAPEQLLGQPGDAQADLYAVAGVFYEMVTGRAPFIGDQDQALVRAVINDPPEPPRQLQPSLPEWIDQVVLLGLGKDAADRYRTAAEFRVAVEACLTKAPSEGARSGTGLRSSGPVQTAPHPAAEPPAASAAASGEAPVSVLSGATADETVIIPARVTAEASAPAPAAVDSTAAMPSTPVPSTEPASTERRPMPAPAATDATVAMPAALAPPTDPASADRSSGSPASTVDATATMASPSISLPEATGAELRPTPVASTAPMDVGPARPSDEAIAAAALLMPPSGTSLTPTVVTGAPPPGQADVTVAVPVMGVQGDRPSSPIGRSDATAVGGGKPVKTTGSRSSSGKPAPSSARGGRSLLVVTAVVVLAVAAAGGGFLALRAGLIPSHLVPAALLPYVAQPAQGPPTDAGASVPPSDLTTAAPNAAGQSPAIVADANAGGLPAAPPAASVPASSVPPPPAVTPPPPPATAPPTPVSAPPALKSATVPPTPKPAVTRPPAAKPPQTKPQPAEPSAPAALPSPPATDAPRSTPGTTPSTTGTNQPAQATPLPEVSFRKVKFVSQEGSNAREIDSVLMMLEDRLSVAPAGGGGTLKSVRYSAITGASYARATQKRLGFIKSARHLMTIDAGADILILRLDKDNFDAILKAFEARTGLTVPRGTGE